MVGLAEDRVIKAKERELQETDKEKKNINHAFPNPANIKNTQHTRFLGDNKYKAAAASQVTVSQSIANDSNETGTHRCLRKPKAHFHTMMHVNWTKALRILRICKKQIRNIYQVKHLKYIHLHRHN